MCMRLLVCMVICPNANHIRVLAFIFRSHRFNCARIGIWTCVCEEIARLLEEIRRIDLVCADLSEQLRRKRALQEGIAKLRLVL